MLWSIGRTTHTQSSQNSRSAFIVQLVRTHARARARLSRVPSQRCTTTPAYTNEYTNEWSERVYKFAHMKRNKLMRAHTPFGRKCVVCVFVCLCARARVDIELSGMRTRTCAIVQRAFSDTYSRVAESHAIVCVYRGVCGPRYAPLFDLYSYTHKYTHRALNIYKYMHIVYLFTYSNVWMCACVRLRREMCLFCLRRWLYCRLYLSSTYKRLCRRDMEHSITISAKCSNRNWGSTVRPHPFVQKSANSDSEAIPTPKAVIPVNWKTKSWFRWYGFTKSQWQLSLVWNDAFGNYESIATTIGSVFLQSARQLLLVDTSFFIRRK